jgi:DNA invertase Pin-like site-specific DNA recombinase
MDIHAGVYGRQSLARENKSEVSTATQIEEGKREALKRGAVHTEVYEDLGKSAFSGVVRPDFERLIADCRAGRINMIIVYYVSRFSRMEPLDAIPIVTELLNLGVTIVSVTEGEFRKGSLMDLIHLIMRLDQAHNESKNKSNAVSSAKRAAKELGGFVGGQPPFGFDLIPEMVATAGGRSIVIQRLCKNTTEPPIIREAWARIKRHMTQPYEPGKPHPGSLNGICIQFNDEHVPTRGQLKGKRKSASRWEVHSLRRTLRDPRIAGFEAEPVYAEKADGTLSHKAREYRVKRDPETLEPIVFDHDPIMHPAEWYQLQAWLDGRGQGKGLERRETLLSGLRNANNDSILTCECGRSFSGLNTTGKSNKPCYRCTRAKGGEYPGEHEGTNTITQEYLDDYVAGRILALLRSVESVGEDDELAAILTEATRRFGRATEAPETFGERSSLLADRADAVDALNGIADGLVAARTNIVRDRLMEQEAIAADRLARLDARLGELDRLNNPVLPFQEWLPEDLDADPLGPGSWWHSATLDQRRELVALFVDRITITKAVRRYGHSRWTPYDVHARATITWAKPRKGVTVS